MGRTSDARERLIDATVDLVWQSSYGAVSVDAICDRARVKKGSFYHFFESKDALVVAALEHYWESRRPVLDALFSPSLPPVERLARYLAYQHVRQTEVRERYGRVLGCFHNSVGAECIQQPEEVGAKVQEVIALLRRYLETAIRDGAADGTIPSKDPIADARTLFAYIQGVLLQARIHDQPELLRELPARAFALLGIQEAVRPHAAKKAKARSSAARKHVRA